MNIVARIKAFFAPNLGKVLGKFDKVIIQLDKVLTHEAEREALGNQLVASGNNMIADAKANQKRATQVKTNLSNLLGR